MWRRTWSRWLPGALVSGAAILVAAASSAYSDKRSPARRPALDANDGELRRLLESRLRAIGPGGGIVVGIRTPEGRRFFSAGDSGVPGLALDGRALFEIGSITKTYNATLLAVMAQSGQVRLDQELRELAPPRPYPEWVASITLEDLARHRSGLPRVPLDVDMLRRVLLRRADPYGGTRVDGLFDALAGLGAGYKPDANAERRIANAYSNLGAAVLGQLLAGRASQDWPSLLRARVLDPLRLGDTWAVEPEQLPPPARARLVQGHDEAGEPTSPWHGGAYAPAGILRASADDVLAFLEAHLRGDPALPPGTWSDLLPWLSENEPATDPERPRSSIGLGWFVTENLGDRIVWHNGGTGGFRSFAAFDIELGLAIVVLSNRSVDVDELGMHLINAGQPLRTPSTRRAALISGCVIAAVLLSWGMGVMQLDAWRRRALAGRPLHESAPDQVSVWIALASGALALGFVLTAGGGPLLRAPWSTAWQGLAALLALSWLCGARALPLWSVPGRWRLALRALGLALLLGVLLSVGLLLLA